ncbi:MAG: threonine--tRNA ligase [Patescibacteria group bacterium]|jgi:threonyl-tRNA synthetase
MTQEQLSQQRHSLAHLLAAAVLSIWPDAKRTIGPAIDNGFYYDFEFASPITEADLPKIEKRMKKLLTTWKSFDRHELSASEVKKEFSDNPYKLELIEEFSGEGQTLTVYQSGDFRDLCRGGHTENFNKIDPESFCLHKLAGAYWRGDEKNKMLTRIYGLAFESKDELADYLKMLSEAEKRDHKKLGPALELFAFSPLVGPGLPMFLPKGALLLRELAEFVRAEKINRGYNFVSIPHIAKAELYKKSGHLGKYDAMMPLMKDAEGDEFALKAMNCPHHFELFNATPHSYRDLPIRYAENTTVYRNEKSGELSGLLRVKALTQDDTHHFVRHDQINSEITMILGLMDTVYKAFGFTNFLVQISVRDQENKSKYFGSDELWEKSENILIQAAKDWGKPYIVEKGEAAFYGPKIDIMVKDAIGRSWQLTTVQLDFNQPENFDLHYIAEDGQKHRPAVLHVAILGSLERFLGVLIEHYTGAFPLWLSPVQIKILNVGEAHEKFCQNLAAQFKAQNIRVELDLTSETVGKKIRKSSAEKIPYTLVIGDKEMNSKNLSVRVRGFEELWEVDSKEFITQIQQLIAKRSAELK